MDAQDKFNRIDEACKKLGLTNIDIAVILQVTTAMVSRYRNGKAENIGRRDKDKLPRAARAVKYLRVAYGKKGIKAMTPQERVGACIEAIKEADPELEEVRAPLV